MPESSKRPSLNRKVTPKSEKNRKADLDQGVTIVVDGKDYTVRAGDLTGLDVAALRRETGMSFSGLLTSMMADADVDLIAALMWLSRRVAGEVTLTYAEVAGEVGYDIDIEVKDAAEDDSDPEA